jgi:selenocysteine lyase/cysteine desulfurase
MNREHFPALIAADRDGRTLADNAAGAQLPEACIEGMRTYAAFDNAQKGGLFTRPERTYAMIADAKAAFAELADVAAETIGVGANATSIAFALARNVAPTIRPGDRVVVTAVDHYANVMSWSYLARFGAAIDIVPALPNGDLDEAAYARALAQSPVLVALPWASNATGTVFPVRHYARQAKAAGAIVAVDGVQAAPHFPLTIDDSIDFAFFSAYKIYAPHIGFFYARPDAAERFFRADDPYLPSAQANWSIETGTQSSEGLAGWLGTVAYLRTIADGDLRAAMAETERVERDLARYALRAFAARADRIALYGRTPAFDRLPVFAFNVVGMGGEHVARALDAAGIEARFGDYYAPRLLKTMAPDRDGTAVRLSFAHYNTESDVDRCFAALDALRTGAGSAGSAGSSERRA